MPNRLTNTGLSNGAWGRGEAGARILLSDGLVNVEMVIRRTEQIQW